MSHIVEARNSYIDQLLSEIEKLKLEAKSKELTYREECIIQSCLYEKIVRDHQMAISVHVSKEGAEMFSNNRDEAYALFQKFGGRNTLEYLLRIHKECGEKVEKEYA